MALRRRSRKLSILLAAALAGGVAPTVLGQAGAPATPPPPDGVFRVDLTQTSPVAWSVSSPAMTSGHGAVAGTNSPAPVVAAWNPATREMSLTLSTTLTAGTMTDPHIVVDFITPSYEAVMAPDGVRVASTCSERPFYFGLDTGGPRYGECFPATAAAGGVYSATVPLGVGLAQAGAMVEEFQLTYHLEDFADHHKRVGLPAQAPTPGAGKLLQPAGAGQYLGFYTDQVTFYGNQINKWASKVGSSPAIVYTTDPPFPRVSPAELVDLAERTADRGAVYVTQFGIAQFAHERDAVAGCTNYTWQTVVESGCGGVLDDLYRSYAVALRDAGVPIVLSLLEEGSPTLIQCAFGPAADECWQGRDRAFLTQHYGDPDEPDATERYRDFHRHVVDIFTSVGAANVTWMIETQPETSACKPTEAWWWCAANLYPGDEYIDWLGVNFTGLPPVPGAQPTNRPSDYEYERGGSDLGYTSWTTLAPTKPVMSPNALYFTQYGGHRDDRSDRWRDLFAKYPTKYPKVKAVAWWDQSSDLPAYLPVWGPDPGFYHRSEIDAFREKVADGFFLAAPNVSSDVTPPAAITDLSVSGTTATFTAPGDDAAGGGTVSVYTLRCRPGTSVDAASWSRYGFVERRVPGTAAPGTTQSITLPGWAASSGVCAVTATDDVNQTSKLSNSVIATTFPAPPPPPPPPPPPGPPGAVIFSESGTIALMDPIQNFSQGVTMTSGCGADGTPLDNVDGAWIALPAASGGKTATLTSRAGGDAEVHFYGEGCLPLGDGGMDTESTSDEVGVVPADATYALVSFIFGLPQVPYTFNLHD